MYSVGTSCNILLLSAVTKCSYKITVWNFAESANLLIILPERNAALFNTNCKLLALASCRHLQDRNVA